MHRLKRKISDVASRRKHRHNQTPSKSAYALATACAALIPTSSSLRSLGQSHTRIIQNFQLVYLDANCDENNNYYNTMKILRHIVNTVNIFTNVNKCIDYIDNVKEEKIFLIVPEILGQTIVPRIHDMPQIYSIYIFCENKFESELWVNKWSKIKGVFMDMTLLCEILKQAAYSCDKNLIPISFVKINNEIYNQNLDELDQSFVHTLFLKKILLTMKFKQQDLKEFTTYYHKLIVDNVAELKNLNEFEQEYYEHEPIWWYTGQSFLNSILNRALCTMEIDIIIKMGFFIRDLHENITQLYNNQYANRSDSTALIVYRGQGMSQIDFDQLKKTANGLLSFNNFLFASKDRRISLNFVRQTVANSDLIGILFVITIDSSIISTPFANIRHISYHQIEEEILFTIHSIFRIGKIKQIDNNQNNNNLWQVELTLSNDNDSKLHTLIEHIVENTSFHTKGWCQLNELWIKEGQLDKAQQLCDTILNQTSDDMEKSFVYYQLGLIKYSQEEYTEANSFYHKSLDIRLKIYPSEHINIAMCYNDIGLVYEKLNDYAKAILSFEKALTMYTNILPINNSSLSKCNTNIARIYFQIDEYSKSVLHYENALESYQNTLPSTHPDIIDCYNNIGLVYEKMGEYLKAISFYEKILTIQKKSFPLNYIDIADWYNTIGSLYEKLREYSIALTYYEKSLEIYEENFPLEHPDLAACYTSIGLVYFQRSEYLNALLSYEKAHEIYRKILPPNAPQLAASYAYQGAVYRETDKYAKALLYYEKAIEIYQKNDSSHHIELATVYSKISLVYFQKEDYKAALSYHKKTLEIYQKYLPQNHSDLAESYIWHGDLYDKLGDRMNAVLYYEYALKIGQHAFPGNNCLQRWKSNLERIKKKL